MTQETLSVKNGQLGSTSSVVLPVEILATIFEWCLPAGSERLEWPLQRLAPLALTFVCRLWRDICLSLPTLWTNIVLGHMGSDPESDVPLLDLWLARSGILPISLKLNYEVDDGIQPVFFDREKNEKYINGMYKLVGLTVSCIERWSSFEIHTLDISVLEKVFLALVTRGSPTLKNLAFSTKYLGFFGDVHVLDFSKCSALQAICLRSPMISPVSQSATMVSMTTLELRFCSSIEDCLRWIDICPALEKLIVRLFCSNPEILLDQLHQLTSPENAPRSLPRLKELELHNFSTEADVGPLLIALRVPALRSLKINMYGMIDAVGRWTHVLDLVRRCEPKLETLEINGTPMATVDIIECLRLLPTVQNLTIGTSGDTNDLLGALSIAPTRQNSVDGKYLCPALKVLDVVGSTWSCDLLASTVCSRSPLAKATYSTQNSEDPEPIETLEELRLDAKGAALAKLHPVLAECVSLGGLKIVEEETNLLIAAFDNPEVVFV